MSYGLGNFFGESALSPPPPPPLSRLGPGCVFPVGFHLDRMGGTFILVSPIASIRASGLGVLFQWLCFFLDFFSCMSVGFHRDRGSTGNLYGNVSNCIR